MDQNQLHYGISLKLYFENKAFGPGMSTLLRGVESTGSLPGGGSDHEHGLQQSVEDVKGVGKGMGVHADGAGGLEEGTGRFNPYASGVGCWRHTMPSWQRQDRTGPVI